MLVQSKGTNFVMVKVLNYSMLNGFLALLL